MTNTAEIDARVQDHLRNHLTDGAWHDSCPFCLDRRRNGGNGVTPAPKSPRRTSTSTGPRSATRASLAPGRIEEEGS